MRSYFSPIGCGFSTLSSMHYIPWILSMYTYCMHCSQSHQAPQNNTACDRQKSKIKNSQIQFLVVSYLYQGLRSFLFTIADLAGCFQVTIHTKTCFLAPKISYGKPCPARLNWRYPSIFFPLFGSPVKIFVVVRRDIGPLPI